jgi:uncharacterized membrane protein YfhO
VRVGERNAFPQSKLQIAQYDPNYVRLTAVVERDADLILLDNDYPGWRGFVDGKECQIRPYQKKYRLLGIPAGYHEVSFRFEPRSFRYGLWISGITLIGCLGISMTSIVKSLRGTAARAPHRID